MFFYLSQTYMLDNLGNQYNVNNWQNMRLGASGTSQHIEPNLPMKFYLSVGKVDQAAHSVSIVMGCGYYGQGLTNRQETVTLRHVPIREGEP